jgi:hypothetical protein
MIMIPAAKVAALADSHEFQGRFAPHTPWGMLDSQDNLTRVREK